MIVALCKSRDHLTSFSAPSAPIMSTPCQTEDSTTEVCVRWQKPPGGDAINFYLLQWKDTAGDPVNATIPHHRGQAVYNYTIKELPSGYTINVTVTTISSAGKSNVASDYFTTGKLSRDITSCGILVDVK